METKENMQQTQMKFVDITYVPDELLNKSERDILDAIHASGTSGIIAAELCRELPQYAYGTVTSKFKKMVRLGLISVIGQRKGPHGVMQKIWQHVDFETKATRNHG
jgi:predicted transcriptional regulator